MDIQFSIDLNSVSKFSFSGEDDEELDADFGSASKKRRKSVKAKKSAANKCAYQYAVSLASKIMNILVIPI